MANKSEIYNHAKGLWLDLEKYKIAYKKAFLKDQKNNNRLKIAVVISAILTTLSTAVPVQWFAVLPALVTAALAAIDQQFSFADKSQKNWKCQSELEGIKRDLSTWAIQFSKDENSDGTNAVREFSISLQNTINNSPIVESQDDERKARENFLDTVIYSIQKNYELIAVGTIRELEAVEAEDVDEFDAPAEDAPDIISASN